MDSEYSVINFRVTPEERMQLRILLMQEGCTLQDFFGQVVKNKLAQAEIGILTPVTLGKD